MTAAANWFYEPSLPEVYFNVDSDGSYRDSVMRGMSTDDALQKTIAEMKTAKKSEDDIKFAKVRFFWINHLGHIVRLEAGKKLYYTSVVMECR